MTHYDLRLIGRIVYGAALMVANVACALWMADHDPVGDGACWVQEATSIKGEIEREYVGFGGKLRGQVEVEGDADVG